MILSIHVILTVVLTFALAHSYKIDIVCPAGSRFESQCATFFNPSNLNLTNIQLNLIESVDATKSKIVFCLDDASQTLEDNSTIRFFPIFTFNYRCQFPDYYSSAIAKATQNLIELLYMEVTRITDYTLVCETKAESFCNNLEMYVESLDMTIAGNIITDDPAAGANNILQPISSNSNSAILLFYHDIAKIEAFLSESSVQNYKNVGKIITFGIVDEFATAAAAASGSIYEGTYSVNGFFESLSDSLPLSINSDVFFISYVMLKYLDEKLIEDEFFEDTILNLQSIMDNFNFQFGEDNMKIMNSYTIQRTKYFGKVGTDGKVVDIVNLLSNVYESPYTLFNECLLDSSNNRCSYTICNNMNLVDDENVQRIAFLSKKSLKDNNYFRGLYSGFLLSMSKYQQNNNAIKVDVIIQSNGTFEGQIQYLMVRSRIFVYYMDSDMYDGIEDLFTGDHFIITVGYHSGQICNQSVAHISF